MRRGGYLEEMGGFIYVMRELCLRTLPLCLLSLPFFVVYFFVGDFRTEVDGRFGRIPEPEDIIGSVLVKEGELQPETYQAMPTYRFVTRVGPMKLSPFLLERLRSKLRENGLGEKA